MSIELILGVRLNVQTLTTIKLSDVNVKSKIKDLKKEMARRVKLVKKSFELIYCGCILDDDLTVESYGLKNGAMIHVLKKNDPEVPPLPKKVLEDDILQLVSSFKRFKKKLAYQSSLHRLSKRIEVIDNIISKSPGLHEDIVAIAMLQDPDLMAHFTDIDTVRRIAKAHPALIEAAKRLACAVYVEVYDNENSGSNSSNSQPAAYSYSLDNLSDDEEMAGDSSQSSDSTQAPNLSTNPSNAAITTAQLAAALSRATERGFPLSNSSSTSGASTNSGVITTEMFSQAMQQAIATTPVPIATPNLPPILPPILPQFTDLQRQLAQMHEMGLQDDTVNVQALQFTNGDVQAAIELVFSGFSDN